MKAEGKPRPDDLSPALQGALNQQRQEIAQGLHDTLCQSLSGIQLVARMVEKSCAASAEPATIERFKELHGCIAQATTSFTR